MAEGADAAVRSFPASGLAWALAAALAVQVLATPAAAAPETGGEEGSAGPVFADASSASPSLADDSSAGSSFAEDSSAARTPEEAALVGPSGEVEEPGEAVPQPPLWMETYSEGVYSRHEDDNTAGFGDFKIGKRFDIGMPLDLYAKARGHRDARDFFWNNHLDAGVGVRVNLLERVALSLYAEALTGFYYRTSATVGDLAGLQSRIDRNRAALEAVESRFQGLQFTVFQLANGGSVSQGALDSLDALATSLGRSLTGVGVYLDSLETTRDSLRQVADSLAQIPAGPLVEYRAGFVFWYGRGQELGDGAGNFNFPLRFWCDLYGEGLFSALWRTVRTRGDGDAYRDSTARFANFILYANPDAGLVLMDGPAGSLAAYATLYAWFDTHQDWWNNRAMAGPGLRLKPFRDFDLVLAGEYLWGAYYGREREEDPNPYPSTFQDVRLQASFWYGVGL